MVISNENIINLTIITQGVEKIGSRKFVEEIKQKRRALGVINQNHVVNNKNLPQKNQICEKKLLDSLHLPLTRKFSSQLSNPQQQCQDETKKLKTSVPNSNTFGDCIFVDYEDEKEASDQQTLMSLEDMDTKISESDPMEEEEEVEMEDALDDDDDPIINIDDCDAKNPLAVVDYIEDMFSHYRKTESLSCVSPNYMAQQSDINEKMRAILIDWLVEVHDKFELLKETLFLTVNVIDRFLSKQSIVRKKLQLVGLVAMLLACKYEEVSVPIVSDLILISDKAYTRHEVIEMESLMLNTLQFNMSLPTSYVFMERFLNAARSDKKLEMMSYFLIELALVEYEMLKFTPSMLAAAAIYAAQYTLYGFRNWSRTCQWYTTYSEHQLLECAMLMVGLHEKAGKGKLTGVHRKYSTSKFGYTSKSEPAQFQPNP